MGTWASTIENSNGIHVLSISSISESQSLTGQILVAMPGLRDPNFSGTLSLICEHGEDGAIAFVLNHALKLDLRDVLEQIGLNVTTDIADQKVLSGGPVAVERGFVLHKASDQKWQSTLKISSDICVTTSQDIMVAMATGDAPEGATLVLGYAGWGKGQLEQEILDNAWLTVPASMDVIFDTDIEERLKVATGNAGIDYSRVSMDAGHA